MSHEIVIPRVILSEANASDKADDAPLPFPPRLPKYLLFPAPINLFQGIILPAFRRLAGPQPAGVSRPDPCGDPQATLHEISHCFEEASMSCRRLLLALALLAFTSLAFAQSWIPLTNQPNANYGFGNPLLLTDGTVILHAACGPNWVKLTPDHFGSYVNGTFSQIAPLPKGYAPLYFGSAVLPDGRVMMAGGEYNAPAPGQCQPMWTPLGAIYDPKKNKWTAVAPPAGWQTIGDSSSVILADGTYMQSNCCDIPQALLDPTTLTWTITGTNKFDVSDEEGYTLLPNGTVLDVDTYIFKYRANGKNYEIYNPKTGRWHSGPKSGTIVQLWDSYPDEQSSSQELGPAVLRPDGTVIVTGANGAPGEPGHTSIYDTATGTWTPGPDLPGDQDIADGPGALLPDGNVLFMTSPGIFQIGSHFYEWDGSTFTEVTSGMTDAPSLSSYYGNMLVLPTGEILFTDFGNVWIYRSSGKPNPAWAPQIASVPSTVSRGQSYTISGYNFNGFSQGASYGDDVQAATNYPLVRFTNRVTGVVTYARTHDHSTMGIAYPGIASTTFDVSPRTPTGLSWVQVVANGIASPIVTINIK
jgi:hypothetical protein